ncbi:MAG: O-antigen ligase family protein [Terriglobales bacterium]|jgi:O-antigen ligase
MKTLETYGDAIVAKQPEVAAPRFGALAGFVALTALTAIVATALGKLKYGVLNLLGLIAGLIVLYLLAMAFPQLRANWAYLRPRLNKWHLIWYGIYVSALVFEVRTLASYRDSILDSWSILRLGPELLIGVYLLYCAGTGKVKWFSSLFKGIPGVLALYCTFCALTSVWSVFGPWTLFKSVEYMMDVAVVAAFLCVVTDADDYKVLLDWTWTIFTIELVWCVMQLGIWPTEALEDGRLRGVLPLTGFNAVGSYGAIIATVALCRLLAVTPEVFERSWYISLFLFGVVLTVMSQTRNAMAGLVGAIVVILIVSKRATGIMLIGMTVAGILYTTLGEVLKTFIHRGQSEDAFNSMSGRLVWWHYAWIFFKEKPWSGVGAYAGGKFAVLKALNINASSTHSDYIELLVGTGVFGTLLFSIAVVWTLVALFKLWRNQSLTRQERQISMECFCVMLVLFIHSFFNVELTWHAPMFFLVCMGWAEFMRRKRQKAQQLFIQQSLRGPIHRTSEIIFSES